MYGTLLDKLCHNGCHLLETLTQKIFEKNFKKGIDFLGTILIIIITENTKGVNK